MSDFAIFIACQEDITGGGSCFVLAAEVHVMEHGAVQGNAQSAISAHNHASRELSVRVSRGVDLESTDTAFFPAAFVEVEKLALGRELGGFVFLAGFNFGGE